MQLLEWTSNGGEFQWKRVKNAVNPQGIKTIKNGNPLEKTKHRKNIPFKDTLH